MQHTIRRLVLARTTVLACSGLIVTAASTDAGLGAAHASEPTVDAG